MIKVTIFDEAMPLDIAREELAATYPDGLGAQLAAILQEAGGFETRVFTQANLREGLSAEALADTDVLLYWSHKNWRDVPDDIVDAMQERVLAGMGLVLLHSAHASKIFTRLMGTNTRVLRWREAGELQRYFIVAPWHPIAKGLPAEYFEVPHDETYGEPFQIPQPDEQVFISWCEGGEVFRSGCCYRRGAGRIFYFQGGHETFPVYYQKEVKTVIVNACRWAKADERKVLPTNARNTEPLKPGVPG